VGNWLTGAVMGVSGGFKNLQYELFTVPRSPNPRASSPQQRGRVQSELGVLSLPLNEFVKTGLGNWFWFINHPKTFKEKQPMKLIKTAFVSALALTLMACGGGGDSSTTPINATPTLNTAEFLGTWHRMDVGSCFSTFSYGNYWFTADPIVITDTTLASTLTAYTDAACTLKAGKVTETYTVNFSQGSVAGKTNVLRVNLVYSGSTSGADGGSGLTLTKTPDGSGTGGNSKGLLDVDSSKLYPGDPKSALDADGYPTTISTTVYYTR